MRVSNAAWDSGGTKAPEGLTLWDVPLSSSGRSQIDADLRKMPQHTRFGAQADHNLCSSRKAFISNRASFPAIIAHGLCYWPLRNVTPNYILRDVWSYQALQYQSLFTRLFSAALPSKNKFTVESIHSRRQRRSRSFGSLSLVGLNCAVSALTSGNPTGSKPPTAF
jgi:hypothetical protein